MPLHLDGRPVYNRAALTERTGLSLSALEKLYRERATTGHPEHVGTLNRAKVWDAETFEAWWRPRETSTELATLDQLADLIERSPKTTEAMWSARTTNGHPPPDRTVAGTNYFDPEQYLTWYRTQYLPNQPSARTLHRRGDPEDRITLSEAARELGMQPGSITKYVKRPPRGWPHWDPEHDRSLPGGGIRHHWRRGDIWAYAETPRTGGGRRPDTSEPAGSYPHYTGDPRLDIAHQALTNTPPEQHPDLPRHLTTEHPDTSAGTWANILTAARRQPE